MSGTTESRGEIPPTKIMLPGPLTVGELSLRFSRYDLRERVVITYPNCETGSALDEQERYRKLASGLITYDTKLRLIQVGGEYPFEVEPTPNENAIFDLLTAQEGQVMSREDLSNTVLGASGQGHTVDVHISNLRGKLGDARGYIATRRSVGFYAVSDFKLPLDP